MAVLNQLFLALIIVAVAAATNRTVTAEQNLGDTVFVRNVGIFLLDVKSNSPHFQVITSKSFLFKPDDEITDAVKATKEFGLHLTECPSGSEYHSVCGQNYTYIPGRCYKYYSHSERASWQEARERCRGEGGVFYHPAGEWQLDRVLAGLLHDGRHSAADRFTDISVGFSDLKTPGDFMTVDGVPLYRVFNRWVQSGPSADPHRRCGMLLMPDRKLYTSRCDTPRPYICARAAPPGGAEREGEGGQTTPAALTRATTENQSSTTEGLPSMPETNKKAEVIEVRVAGLEQWAAELKELVARQGEAMERAGAALRGLAGAAAARGAQCCQCCH